jgi:hypothetical protein
MSYRGLLLIIGSLPLLVAAGTWVLGEQIEVAVLRTFSEDGHGHDTKMWVVDHQGQPWLRGARPNLEWLARIRQNSRVELERRGVTTSYTARIDESPEARLAINEAMAAKYGWIDRWYEFIMRFEPIPIRLDPATGAG